MKKCVTTLKKRSALVSIAAIAGISISPLTLASSSEPAVVSSSTSASISNAAAAVGGVLKEITITIQASAMALAHKTDTMIYQLDAALTPSMEAATTNQSALEATRTSAQDTTESQVKDTLWAFPETIITPDTSTQDGSDMKTSINARNALYDTLTFNAPASDTLYVDDASLESQSTYASVIKPTTNNDNYFNFDTLFSPDAYTTDAGTTAAQQYIEFTGQLYAPFTDGVNYSTLKSNLNNYSSADDKADYLKGIVENPTYQTYQLAIRSLVASRSAAVSNFNYMSAERTPVADLGKNAGMPDDPNLTSGYASPLQVQNYVLTHRINDPDWYNQMKHATPTTLQREQLFIAAETEAQLQRNYIMQERMLATMSAVSLQSSAMQKMSLKSQVNDVNNLITPSDTST